MRKALKSLVMIKDPKMIEEITLPNGLNVQFYDYSRRVAGDRWLVGLLVRIPIKVEREDFSTFENGEELYKGFLEKHGDEIAFELQKERNFIDEREKDEIFSTLLSTLKKHALSYMGHKDFAKGFKKRKIEEFKQRLSWWK